MRTALPVAVIGGGPVGLAAAVHLLERNLEPVVLEAGPSVGASVRAWGHVRVFSPWSANVDRLAVAWLERSGWNPPPADEYPTGNEIVERYLLPLAQLPELSTRIHTGARVTGVARVAHDRLKNGRRSEMPFVVRYEIGGVEHELLTQAVIDASGTWTEPNPLGASGLPARGERALAAAIVYGIPDVLDKLRGQFAGRRVLVVGSGHSAAQALLDLATLPETRITWAIRRSDVASLLGGANDQLVERGRLGQRLKEIVEAGRVRVVTDFRVAALSETPSGIVVADDEGRTLDPVDEIIAATGFRPDLDLVRELRLDLDPATESPRALGPLIDPNVHSCGTVPPHGAVELAQPEQGFYIVGMKSYGRAPTFLLMTGYEQVRSVVAALAGDWDAARRVELVLPETGVCSTSGTAGTQSCCG